MSEVIENGNKGLLSQQALLARVVWLELRRKEEYLSMAILMGLYLLFSGGARLAGLLQTESVALMLNLGLWMACVISAGLAIILSVHTLSKEFETHTLYPLLAKPVTRGEFISGKFMAVSGAAVFFFGLFFSLTALVWAGAFPLPGQDIAMLFQALLLQALGLMLLSAFSLFLTLVCPPSVAILIGFAVFFGEGTVLALIRSLFHGGLFEQPVNWLSLMIPNHSRLSLMQRFTDGGEPLAWIEFLRLAAYALLLGLGYLGASMRIFSRRPI